MTVCFQIHYLHDSDRGNGINFILGRGPRIFRGRGGPMLGGPMGPVPGPMGPSFGTQFYFALST